MFTLTLLGTGNAAGMPVYGCSCDLCHRCELEPGLKRGPCSALLKVGDKQYLIDAGQVNLHEKFPAGSIDGIFLTHFHPDHVQGLFHLRWGKNLSIPVYCPPDSQGCADLYKHSGILQFETRKKFTSFVLDDLVITPLPLIHSKPTFGYLFEYEAQKIAYLTDTKGLPPATGQYLEQRQLDYLIIDCSFKPGFDGKGHNNLNDVLEMQDKVQASKVVLTHIGHDFDVWLNLNKADLPEVFIIGRDNMQLF